jgi:rhamnosyltransferase
MIYAGTAIKAGYAVAYVATAGVVHSHNYSCRQQFHRNFDIGVSQKQHPEIFEGFSNESEGINMVKGTVRYLQDIHKGYRIPHYILLVASRYAGFRLGKGYRRMPRFLVRRLSLNTGFWEK